MTSRLAEFGSNSERFRHTEVRLTDLSRNRAEIEIPYLTQLHKIPKIVIRSDFGPFSAEFGKFCRNPAKLAGLEPNLARIRMFTGKEMKLRVLNTCVFPTAYYGSESWTFTKNICKRINAFETKCFRKILNVSWKEHRTNISVAREIGVKMGSLLNTIKKQKLKYFGHITRHESLEKTILEADIGGSRRPGRPRRKWEDDVVQWLGRGRGIHQARHLAQDRRKYRLAIGAATSLPG